jgi:hypothetical protein
MATPTPRKWTDAELEQARLAAIADFIAERAAEGSSTYERHLSTATAAVERLLDSTSDLRDLRHGGSSLLGHPDLLDAARYLDGPPISGDDLATVANTTRGRARLDRPASDRIAQVIVSGLDRARFPWLFDSAQRGPSAEERRTAILWTAGLWAAQKTATGRRNESSKRQEGEVKAMLAARDLRQVDSRRIDGVDDLARGEFCPEAIVAGAKSDVPTRLRNGRLLLIECKVSGSAINSVKRLNRECGDKAARWRAAFGQQAYTLAVLSGVFRLDNLRQAQSDGIYIVWQRDLGPLAAFVEAAV